MRFSMSLKTISTDTGRETMVNWPLLISLLRKHGCSTSGVARDLGLHWQHLDRLGRGEVAEPRFSVGIKLLDLAFDKIPVEELRRTRGT